MKGIIKCVFTIYGVIYGVIYVGLWLLKRSKDPKKGILYGGVTIDGIMNR